MENVKHDKTPQPNDRELVFKDAAELRQLMAALPSREIARDSCRVIRGEDGELDCAGSCAAGHWCRLTLVELHGSFVVRCKCSRVPPS